MSNNDVNIFQTDVNIFQTDVNRHQEMSRFITETSDLGTLAGNGTIGATKIATYQVVSIKKLETFSIFVLRIEILRPCRASCNLYAINAKKVFQG
jgi:hypothetical protein